MPPISMPPQRSQKLAQILNGLRYFGVGSKVTRHIYKKPDTYWVITRVQLTPGQNSGKIWGQLVWRGRPKPFGEERINMPLKRQWRLVELPDYNWFKGSDEHVDMMIPKNTERTC